jgi:hypothetical protein
MTFLLFEESWQVARHYTWSSNINCWIDNKLIYLIISIYDWDLYLNQLIREPNGSQI